MNDMNSTGYYQSRERRERELAEAASNPAISAIHLQMAVHYSDMIAKSSRTRRDGPEDQA